MASYKIKYEHSLGVSHYGSVVVKGSGKVELSDEEVDNLVQLIREKNTTDIEKLELEKTYPSIFNKLDWAYNCVASDALNDHYASQEDEYGEYEFETEYTVEIPQEIINKARAEDAQ